MSEQGSMSDAIVFRSEALLAMEEFAQQQACEFAEWLTDNFYTVDSNFMWYDTRKEMYEIELFTTAELYEHYRV